MRVHKRGRDNKRLGLVGRGSNLLDNAINDGKLQSSLKYAVDDEAVGANPIHYKGVYRIFAKEAKEAKEAGEEEEG